MRLNLIGPVYICHPYSAPTAEARAANVRSAAELSSAVNALGCSTISPLQESLGRETAMREEGWLANGLSLLRVCKAVVAGEGWGKSSGCLAEMREAHRIGIPTFHAISRDGEWSILHGFSYWVLMQRESGGGLLVVDGAQ